MQITIKPARMWLLGADILLVTVLTTNFLQQKYHFNIAVGITLGPILGIVLTMLMMIKKVGKIFQIGMSYCWTSRILKSLGITISFKGKNEYYFIFAIILIVITMIHITQIEDLKAV